MSGCIRVSPPRCRTQRPADQHAANPDRDVRSIAAPMAQAYDQARQTAALQQMSASKHQTDDGRTADDRVSTGEGRLGTSPAWDESPGMSGESTVRNDHENVEAGVCFSIHDHTTAGPEAVDASAPPRSDNADDPPEFASAGGLIILFDPTPADFTLFAVFGRTIGQPVEHPSAGRHAGVIAGRFRLLRGGAGGSGRRG